jgi:hypothetical protein
MVVAVDDGESLDFVPLAHVVERGPESFGSEERWRVRLADGTRAVVARLSPELACDESLRRRWVRDVEALAALDAWSLAPLLCVGPSPDPRDPEAIAPFRVRVEPAGVDLATWLARAPMPLDEVARVVAAVADAVFAVHERGAVLRDLHPRAMVLTDHGRVVLTDVGLSRVDVLSSRTASSLLVEGSPYASPEQLVKTTLDQRSDAWAVGVILWQALTGTVPYGDERALLRDFRTLPPLAELRPDAPPVLDVLLRRVLDPRVELRPESVSEIAWVLRGGATDLVHDPGRTRCQECGAPMALGQRLCLVCGRVGVVLRHVPTRADWGYGLDLARVSEDAGQLASLWGLVDDVSARPGVRHEFLTEHGFLYDEDERRDGVRLPARLFNDLDAASARRLAEEFRTRGLSVEIFEPERVARLMWMSFAAVSLSIGMLVLTVFAASTLAFATALTVGACFALSVIATGILGSRAQSASSERHRTALFHLRPAPVALPSSDPWVRRLGALLEGEVPEDVRGVVAEIATLVQRLVDHRARLRGAEAHEIELAVAPVEELVPLVEAHVARLRVLDVELAGLEEGRIVRGIASATAKRRDDERSALLGALDRLRALEERRAQTMHALLEAASLVRRAVTHGLAIHDEEAAHERHVRMALSALGGDEDRASLARSPAATPEQAS